MGNDYVALDDYKAEYEIDREDHDQLITGMIGSASRLVDSICRRRFYVAAADETIKFDYIFPRYLDFREDLFSLTSIVNGDGRTMDLGHVVLYPGHGPPYLWTELTFQKDPFVGDGFGNRQVIQIIGQWGYSDDETRPDAVRRAALMLTNWMYRNPEGISKGVGPARIGADDILDMVPAPVLIILDPYVREWFGSHDMWTSQQRSFTWWGLS